MGQVVSFPRGPMALEAVAEVVTLLRVAAPSVAPDVLFTNHEISAWEQGMVEMTPKTYTEAAVTVRSLDHSCTLYNTPIIRRWQIRQF